jgi:malto-oligosyltrehalose trehalohydrolase
MLFGAELSGAQVRFRLWAPAHERIELELDPPVSHAGAARGPGTPQRLALQREDGGWHSLSTAAQAGACYRFVLPDGTRVPDPASRYQPQDVHGPSEVIDPLAYRWGDAGWRGRPWHEAVLYELHVGTFTAAGTFRAAIERLAHLATLGVTAIELMPLADFPGRRDWGYDGALPFAPDSSYGRPEDLKALIDAAHAHGLMVLLDVVYNHFGPEGNYLPLYAPQFFTERHQTPWGAAINFDGEASRTVREFFIDNALYWLTEYHLDGLRFDAVHAIIDDSPRHILQQIGERVRGAPLPRTVHLVLENEHNEARWLERGTDGAPTLYDAQWNDDVHHVLHVAACGETEGYYGDYHDDGSRLARALAQGFAFQGEPMRYRGSVRGTPCAHLPPAAFVAFIQNHDQVGNRALGERLGVLAGAEALRAVTALYLLLPQVPMLFMGEEWHSAHPFLFFCDFGEQMADAVRKGRRSEFARFAAFADPAARARIPDPQAESTFLASKLDWEHLAEPAHAAVLRWYTELLAARRHHITPLLPSLRAGGIYRLLAPGAVSVQWRTTLGAELTAAVNLRPEPTAGFDEPPGRLLWQEGHAIDHSTLSAWSVRFSLRF